VPVSAPTPIFRHAYVDDVAEAFIRAINNPVTFYKAYNLAGEEILSIADYVRAIADILGQEAKIVFAPWSWIRQQPDLSDFEAPFVNERFVPDIAQVKRDMNPFNEGRAKAAAPKRLPSLGIHTEG